MKIVTRMMVRQFSSEKLAYGVLGLILLFLVFKKAAQIPVTHDEVNTIELSSRPFWDIVSYADPVPNNHILNTLLIKLGHFVYGDRLMMSRLHNVLSFIPFFIFTVLLGRLLFEEKWIRLGFVASLTLQPYLLDFFSVTRGYGLSVAFEVVSLYFFYKRIKSRSTRHLFYALFWAAIGVYANFTLLNFFIPLGIMLAVHSYIIHGSLKSSGFLKEIVLLGVTSLILGGISIIPFIRMASTGQFVFWGNQGFYTDTVVPLISSCRVGVTYFKWSNETVAHIFMFGFMVSILTALWLGRKKLKTDLLAVAVCCLLLVIGYNYVQYLLADVPFLNARTALFFIPLASIVLGLAVQTLYAFKQVLGLIISMAIGIISVQHFIRGYNGKSCYEWYYDADTHQVLSEIMRIKEQENLTSPITLNCHWIFFPSLSYHIAHDYPGLIEIVPYHKEVQPESSTTFYYTQSDEEEVLKSKYGVIQKYGWGSRLLLRTR